MSGVPPNITYEFGGRTYSDHIRGLWSCSSLQHLVLFSANQPPPLLWPTWWEAWPLHPGLPIFPFSSQSRDLLVPSCSRRPTPQPQQRGIWAMSVTYTTAHGNARSLTHGWRPGSEPASSWILVRWINHWATMETPIWYQYRGHKQAQVSKTLFKHTYYYNCRYVLKAVE